MFRISADWVDWTPLGKPTLCGPFGYTAYDPSDSSVRFVWQTPGDASEDADSNDYRLNILDASDSIFYSAIVADTYIVLDNLVFDSTYTWFVRAFVEGRTSSRVSDWSAGEVTVLSLPCCSVPGDCNHDAGVNVGDIAYLTQYVHYNGLYLACWEEADVNDDDEVDADDISYLVAYLFQSGPAPAACP
ncbi:MAG: dockerin type I domain-containing protein [bacterium]